MRDERLRELRDDRDESRDGVTSRPEKRRRELVFGLTGFHYQEIAENRDEKTRG
jgi:hypothetical protein